MDYKTFNDISEKKLGGAKAFITGKLKLQGNIGTLRNFESNVVNKYFPERKN